jgi:glycosyltransferase involved in cell wall biosynthesis
MSQFPSQKIPLLIASTLKPIRDVRAFGKLALSLSETNTYQLNIIGFSPKKPKSEQGIRFFSSMSHFGSPIDRLLIQARFIKCLLFTRPKILICCTYELLPMASMLKSLFGYKLVYDVQENYVANLALNPTLSSSEKAKIGRLINSAESVVGIDLHLLAEKCYASEMPTKRPFIVLENKFDGEASIANPISLEGKSSFKFCITGTITPAFGIKEAIVWFEEILKVYPGSSLEIIGHCPLESFWGDLTQFAKRLPHLSLRISREPVPHNELIDGLRKADFALLPYQQHPAISAKMPTKLYECAALGIPVLISSNPKWMDFLNEFSGGSVIDFSDPSTAVEQLNEAIKTLYFNSPRPESILWNSEKIQLQEAIKSLL